WLLRLPSETYRYGNDLRGRSGCEDVMVAGFDEQFCAPPEIPGKTSPDIDASRIIRLAESSNFAIIKAAIKSGHEHIDRLIQADLAFIKPTATDQVAANRPCQAKPPDRIEGDRKHRRVAVLRLILPENVIRDAQ